MTATPRHVVGALTLATTLVLGTAACTTPAVDEPEPTRSTSAAAEASEPAPEPTVDAAAEAVAAQQAALEELVAEAQPSIPVLYEQFPGVYSNIAITSEGADTLVYSYVYSAEAVGSTTLAEMQQAMSGQGPALQDACETQVFPAMKAEGITVAPKIRYTYATPTGEEVWTYTCESAS